MATLVGRTVEVTTGGIVGIVVVVVVVGWFFCGTDRRCSNAPD